MIMYSKKNDDLLIQYIVILMMDDGVYNYPIKYSYYIKRW